MEKSYKNKVRSIKLEIPVIPYIRERPNKKKPEDKEFKIKYLSPASKQ
jgi:hypothetical protein